MLLPAFFAFLHPTMILDFIYCRNKGIVYGGFSVLHKGIK